MASKYISVCHISKYPWWDPISDGLKANLCKHKICWRRLWGGTSEMLQIKFLENGRVRAAPLGKGSTNRNHVHQLWGHVNTWSCHLETWKLHFWPKEKLWQSLGVSVIVIVQPSVRSDIRQRARVSGGEKEGRRDAFYMFSQLAFSLIGLEQDYVWFFSTVFSQMCPSIGYEEGRMLFIWSRN